MRIKRAIILAAGKGERLHPLTMETPKPLIKVNGIRMIESIISALRQNGIPEIYIVVGYQKEKFQWLTETYPGVNLIENPYYETCNNISSLYVTRYYLQDAIVMDGDQLIYDPDVLNSEFDRSGYNAAWCEGETKEWLLDVEGGVIQSCSRTGGTHGYQIYSISRWSKEDGKRLSEHIVYEFERGNTSIYWDDVPLFCYPNEYRLGIREMKHGAVAEIDSLEELAAIDHSYSTML